MISSTFPPVVPSHGIVRAQSSTICLTRSSSVKPIPVPTGRVTAACHSVRFSANFCIFSRTGLRSGSNGGIFPIDSPETLTTTTSWSSLGSGGRKDSAPVMLSCSVLDRQKKLSRTAYRDSLTLCHVACIDAAQARPARTILAAERQLLASFQIQHIQRALNSWH